MTQEIFIPPGDCPEPDKARTAVQSRFARLFQRAKENSRDPAEWPQLEEQLRSSVAQHNLYACTAPGNEACGSQSSCWLARQLMEQDTSVFMN